MDFISGIILFLIGFAVGSLIVWFVALQREGIKFNRKDRPWKSNQLEFKFTYGNIK